MCTREQYQGADRTFAGEDEHVDAPLARRAETLPYRQSEGMDGVFTSDCQMVRFHNTCVPTETRLREQSSSGASCKPSKLYVCC
jgi:hypothetical protein